MAGLGVAQVGAGTHLEVFLLAGDQASTSRLLTFRSARSPEQHSRVRTGMSRLRKKSTVFCHSLTNHWAPSSGWQTTTISLFFKLMDAVNARCLDAVGAHLFAETGRIAGQGLGQLCSSQDGVDEFADHRVLAGADEIEVLALDLIHHVFHLCKNS